MHVWTLLQHMLIVFTNFLTPVLLSSALFVNKVLTLFTCNNGSEKDTGVHENEHRCDPLL